MDANFIGILQDVDIADVQESHSCGSEVPASSEFAQGVAAAVGADPDLVLVVAPAAKDSSTAVVAAADETILKAVSSATHIKDHAVLASSSNKLEIAVVEEQVRLYQTRSCGAIALADKRKLVINPTLAASPKLSTRS